MPDNGPPRSDETTPKELEFHYEKGNLFRVIHVDGGHGGVSPDGQSLILSVYSERRPIPKREVCDVDEHGRVIQPPKHKEERKAIFREVEAALIMNPATAAAINTWLSKHLQQQQELAKKIEETRAQILSTKEQEK